MIIYYSVQSLIRCSCQCQMSVRLLFFPSYQVRRKWRVGKTQREHLHLKLFLMFINVYKIQSFTVGWFLWGYVSVKAENSLSQKLYYCFEILHRFWMWLYCSITISWCRYQSGRKPINHLFIYLLIYLGCIYFCKHPIPMSN